jgi:hypothetical protein
MATDEQPGGNAVQGSRQTHITGNSNSGVIAGGDIRGGVTLGSVPPPPRGELPPAAGTPDAVKAQPLRILFLGASPVDAQRLRWDQEVREIDLALRQGEFRESFDLRQQLAVRPTDLQTALLRHRPQIVHFSGHGEVDGVCLEDDSGQTRMVAGNVLGRILAVFKKQIRCVVLNSCYSQEQAEAIARDIDCVIGMSREFGDRAAIRFGAAFYQALAFGSSVETAFQLACAQIDLEGYDEGSTPQLIAFRCDPGEVIFTEEAGR